jgi:hypothetical protein
LLGERGGAPSASPYFCFILSCNELIEHGFHLPGTLLLGSTPIASHATLLDTAWLAAWLAGDCLLALNMHVEKERVGAG